MILKTTSELHQLPQRIVSLVPSQTELLHYLGLEKETAGITKFCVHPQDWFKTKTRVGGTKTVNFKIIQNINPDLIIANKEENVKEQIEQLALDHPVWVTDVNNLEEALDMIRDIAELTGKKNEAHILVEEIRDRFDQLESKPKSQNQKLLNPQPLNSKPQTAYLIWQKPYMTVGGDTFINDMLSRCGFQNIFADRTRYPETSISELQTLNLKFLLLSSEPYPFKQKHIEELEQQLPGCKILLVDGELFSWYGSRLLQAPEYFKNLVRTAF